MNLYINTSSDFCEIALFNGAKFITHNVHKKPMQHSTILHTLIQKTCLEGGIQLNEIQAIGVMNGPGSYTGLRIGLAAAKGFCYSLQIPLVLMNKLNLCCAHYLDNHSTKSPIACFQTARQGEYFFCMQKDENVISEPSVEFSENINNLLSKHPETICISHEDTVASDIQAEIILSPIPIGFIGKYFSNQLESNNLANVFSAQPFYLKKVHANTPKKQF